MERLGYVKQLVFSRTRLEFRLLWNKVFQKEDEELGWLLNPYRQSSGRDCEATMMSSFNRNTEQGYQQFDFHEASSVYGREKVTIYNRGVSRKAETRKRREKKSFKDNAIQIARYMGMGVYMTSTSFPSPFFPVNDTNIYHYDETSYASQSVYSLSRIW